MANVVERFKTLVPIDNPSGKEDRIREFIQSQLSGMGFTDMTVDAAGNLLVRIAGNPNKATFLLSAHMDSVPPCEGIEPVDDHQDGRPVIRSSGKTILGADDKSGIATILAIAERIKHDGGQEHHPLELLFSTREEIGLLGLKEFDLSQCKASSGFVLDGEGQVGDIFIAGPSQKNMIFDIIGKAAHAGMCPEEGVSAIVMAAHLCVSIPSGRVNADTTMNIGTVQGGAAMNVVAPKAQVRAEARSHNPEELANLMENLQETTLEIHEHFTDGHIDLTIIDKYDRYAVPEGHESIKISQTACQALNITPNVTRMNIGSDAHVLNHGGIPTVVLGMGFHFSHSLGEFIYVDELEQVADLVWEIVRN